MATTTTPTAATFVFVLSDGTERTRTLRFDVQFSLVMQLQDSIEEAADWAKKPGRKAFWISQYSRREVCCPRLLDWVGKTFDAPACTTQAESEQPWVDPWADI